MSVKLIVGDVRFVQRVTVTRPLSRATRSPVDVSVRLELRVHSATSACLSTTTGTTHTAARYHSLLYILNSLMPTVAIWAQL